MCVPPAWLVVLLGWILGNYCQIDMKFPGMYAIEELERERFRHLLVKSQGRCNKKKKY